MSTQNEVNFTRISSSFLHYFLLLDLQWSRQVGGPGTIAREPLIVANRSKSPEYDFVEGGRPLVNHYDSQVAIIREYLQIGMTDLLDQKNRFRPTDKVYYRATPLSMREGPFVIESVAATKQYTLCYENGQKAKDGQVVHEENLEVAPTEPTT